MIPVKAHARGGGTESRGGAASGGRVGRKPPWPACPLLPLKPTWVNHSDESAHGSWRQIRVWSWVGATSPSLVLGARVVALERGNRLYPWSGEPRHMLPPRCGRSPPGGGRALAQALSRPPTSVEAWRTGFGKWPLDTSQNVLRWFNV